MPRILKDGSISEARKPDVQNRIYKVTSAKVTKTMKGYTVFNIELNGVSWASMLKMSSRDAKRRGDDLHQYYDEKIGNLDFLIGYYIAAEVENSPYGQNIRKVNSIYPLEDFRKLLDESKGLAFDTAINIYKFLREKGYPINNDGSITLREPYSGFNIEGQFNGTICYPNNPGENTLTTKNIETIYKRFFKDEEIDTSNPDRSERYYCTSIAIEVHRESYYKNKTGTESTYSYDIFKVGEKLNEEHISYLSEMTSNIKDDKQ